MTQTEMLIAEKAERESAIELLAQAKALTLVRPRNWDAINAIRTEAFAHEDRADALRAEYLASLPEVF